MGFFSVHLDILARQLEGQELLQVGQVIGGLSVYQAVRVEGLKEQKTLVGDHKEGVLHVQIDPYLTIGWALHLREDIRIANVIYSKIIDVAIGRIGQWVLWHSIGTVGERLHALIHCKVAVIIVLQLEIAAKVKREVGGLVQLRLNVEAETELWLGQHLVVR